MWTGETEWFSNVTRTHAHISVKNISRQDAEVSAKIGRLSHKHHAFVPFPIHARSMCIGYYSGQQQVLYQTYNKKG